MAANNRLGVLLLSVFWIQALLTRNCEANSYKGCFPETQKQRIYDVNPGDYDPTSMTTGTCRALCGAYNFKYAALAESRFCFCGNTEPGAATTNANCQDVCSGDANYKCGGKGYVSLFESSPSITDLTITNDAPSPTTVDSNVAFDISVSSGSNVYYQLDYCDGAGLSEKNATDFETRNYSLPGTYCVRVEANDFNDTLPVQKAVTTVVVQAVVPSVDLECDPLFATFEEGLCVATVWQGTGLKLDATIDSDTISFQNIADPVLSQVGPAIPAKDALQSRSTLNTVTVIAPGSLVENPGRVIGWELNVEVKGTLKILILSPSCSGNVYCPLDNTCKASCADAAAVYAVTCSSDNFCPRTRLCDDATCTAPSRFPSTIVSYTVTAVVDVAVTTGYQYVPESSLLEVKTGDILGLDGVNSDARTFVVNCALERVDYSQSGTVSQGDTVTLSSLTAHEDCMAIRAAVSEGSKVSLFYTFESQGNYELTVDVENIDISGGPVSNTTTLQVLEGVNYTIIDGPTSVMTGHSATFTVLPHTGGAANYTWSLQCDDGLNVQESNTNQQSKTFTFTGKGTCILIVTTANAVSNKTNETLIFVQDEVTDLVVENAPAYVNVAHDFPMTLGGGSNYTCAWIWGDGQTNTTDEASTPPGITNLVQHTYTARGDYDFEVTCSNDVSSQFVSFTQVVMYQTVNDVNLNCTESMYAFFPNSPPLLIVVVYSTPGPQPSGPAVHTLQYDSGGTIAGSLVMGEEMTLRFDQTGDFNLAASVSNTESSKDINCSFFVIQRMFEPKIVLPFSKAPRGVQFCVSFCLTRGPLRPHCSLTWDSGDPSIPRVEDSGREGVTQIDSEDTGPGEGGKGCDTICFTYSVVVIYNLTVTATTGLETVSVSKTVEVIHPVLEPDLSVSPSANVIELGNSVTLTTQWSGAQMPTPPVNISITCGDQPEYIEDFPIATDDSMVLSCTPSSDGPMVVIVTVNNEASSVDFNHTIEVCQNMPTMTVSMCSDPGQPCNAGCLATQPFSPDRPIQVTVDTNNVVVSEYEVTATLGSEVIICSYPSSPFELDQLNRGGAWTLAINASNGCFNNVFTTTVNIEPKIVGFEFTVVASTNTNEKTFSIKFTAQGDNTCLMVDFGDGTKFAYADIAADCTDSSYSYQGVLTNRQTISHTFSNPEVDVHSVTALAKNSYNEISQICEVTNLDCSSPTVNIADGSGNFCDEKLKVDRSRSLEVVASIELHCQSRENQKDWKVESVDASGNPTGVFDLTGVSTTEARLVIPPRLLTFGTYKVTICVTMTTDNAFQSCASIFIEVGLSPLVGIMIQGGASEITHGILGGNLVLKPLELSYDPDFDVTDAANHFGLTVTYWTCTYEDLTPCAGIVAAASVGANGQLSYTVPNSDVGKIYKITACMEKDGRDVCATINVNVVEDDPPTALLECKGDSICIQQQEGCRVLKSSSLSMIATCTTCAGRCDDATYLWKLKAYDPWNGWPDGLRPVPQTNVEAEYITAEYGYVSKEILLKSKFFKDYEEYTQFRLEVTVNCNGVSGTIATKILVNQPPQSGTCSIEPKELTSSTTRHIKCQNWVDDDQISRYKIYSHTNDEIADRQITMVETSAGSIDIDVTLSQGLEDADYSMTIFVDIADSLGAITKVPLGQVKVTPLSMEEQSESMDNLLEGTGALVTICKQGDAAECCPQISRLVASLVPAEDAIESDVEESWDWKRESEKEVNRNKRAKAIEIMVAVLDYDLPKSTFKDLNLVMSAMASCVTYPSQINTKTQERIMDYIDSALATMDTITPVPLEERFALMESCHEVMGGIIAAHDSSIADSVLDDLDKCGNTEGFGDYSFDGEETCAGTQSTQPKRMDEAINKQKQESCCQLQKETAQAKFLPVFQKLVKKEVDNLKSKGVQDEEVRFNSLHMKSLYKKTRVKDLTSLEIDYSPSGVEFPAGFLPNTMSDDASIIVVATEMKGTLDTAATNYNKLDPYSYFFFLRVYTAENSGDATPVDVSSSPKEITVRIRMAADTPSKPKKDVSPALTTWNNFQFHQTILPARHNMFIEVCPDNTTVQYVVVVNKDRYPEPSAGQCMEAFLVPTDTKDPPDNGCTIHKLGFRKRKDRKLLIGFRQLAESEKNMDVSNCTNLPHWQKGADDATQFTGNYSLDFKCSVCNSKSENAAEWALASGEARAESNAVRTACESNHMTTFAGGWVVVPNTIDWDYVFNNLDFLKNPTLYITEIVIVLVYILSAIWARRKDKKDVEKLGIAPLMDNDPKDKYYYEIVVVTGMRRNAGTDSKVFFILSGEEDETDVREFSDSKRKIFRRGDTNGFLMSTTRSLGYLNYARVWHDNSGKGSKGGWYLNYMIVRDVQTDEKWVFIADKWFAVEEADGQVDRIIPVATRENMTEFSHMFAEKTRKNLADGHLWFSVVARPPASRFTCLQRVSCCLCLLYVSMLANAMFYNTTPESGTSNGFTLGPFSVSPEQIFIGVISNLIVFPVNFIIITLFRKARPRKLRPSRVDEAIKTAHDGPRTEASVTDIKPEVSSIFSVSRPASMMANNPKPLRPESSLSRPGTSLSTRADATLPNKKKKKSKSLPWWCRIVAWVLLWVSVIVSAAIVTAYGITFADEVCKKWISSMLVSFFMSVFITQPIKVFMLAIFLSLIVKNPGEEEEDEEQKDEEKTKLANDEIPLHDLNADSFGAARPRKIGYKPPDRSTLEAARQKRLNEIQMWAIVREVVIYAFFLWILMVISYRQRNADTFLYKDTMERVFIKNNETDIDFGVIRNVDEYWNWARSGLVNGIRPGPYYNDYPPFLLQGYVNDKVSKILGYAVMRQLRIRPSLCELDERMMAVIRECNVGYDISDQEDGTFDIGWKPITDNSTANDTADWYRYTDADTLNGYPYWGQLGLYAGGGYVVNLKGSKTDLIALMNRLDEEKWIDRYTRAVFVEFTTYNAQVNLFGIATIVAEFHQTGGVVQTHRFEPAMLLPYMSSAMLFQLVCEGTFCFFIIFFLVRLIKVFIKEKLSFFKGFWNLVELGIISMSITAIVIYFYRLFETNRLTSRFKETNGQEYIKFQYVGYWNELFAYMIGWTVFFATIKFMRLLRFNKRMSMLAATLRNGARNLLHFSIIFWIVFLAFTMLFFLSFMTIDIKYSSFVGSMVSGILMMMGKFDIYAMTMAEPVLTQVFVFLFVLSLTFVIVNMFVSILNETFSSVRDDVNKQSNDYEIISFMISRFKHFSGLGPRKNITLTPEELRNQELEQRYAEGRGNSCVDDFPDRIDRLLHSISNVYMEQEHVNAILDKRGYQGMGAKGGGRDNPAFVGGTQSKTSGGLSKVHTH